MCTEVLIRGEEELPHDLLVYKVIKFDEKRMVSMFAPDSRLPQRNNDDRGRLYTYEIGQIATSRFEYSEGLYCYASLDDARAKYQNLRGTKCKFGVFEGYIPKGTRIRLGFAYSSSGDATVIVHTEALVPTQMILQEENQYNDS